MKSLIRTVALATALAAVALVPVAGAQPNNWQHHNGYQNHYNNRANNSYRGDRYYRAIAATATTATTTTARHSAFSEGSQPVPSSEA